MSERLAAAPAEAALDGGREDLPPVPREGVSLIALRAFADEHRGRSFAVPDDAHGGAEVTRSFEELTTAQVCELVIKPATLPGVESASKPCSYAELLISQARPFTRSQRARPPDARIAAACARRSAATRTGNRMSRAPHASSAMRGSACSAACWQRWRRTRTRRPRLTKRFSGSVRLWHAVVISCQLVALTSPSQRRHLRWPSAQDRRAAGGVVDSLFSAGGGRHRAHRALPEAVERACAAQAVLVLGAAAQAASKRAPGGTESRCPAVGDFLFCRNWRAARRCALARGDRFFS